MQPKRFMPRGILAGIGLVAVGAMVGGATSALSSPEFDTVTVRRINVVDDDGTTRLVIANNATIPDAVVRGVTYPRSIGNTAGMVFYGPDGQEVGGLATSTFGEDTQQAALILDYHRQPTDGISIGMSEGPEDEDYRTALSIADRRPYQPGPIKSSQGVRRIAVENDTGDARLIISDTQGRPRIRIGVTKDDRAEIVVLDADGQVMRSLVDEDLK